ncbi:MAG: type II toxin-antitoxin system HicB family antitoxin [Candidatus Odinarchaeota archaeon]
MTERTFTFLIEEDEDSGYVARCLELKGVYGQGETEEEVLKDIHVALDLALETYIEKNLSVPYCKDVQLSGKKFRYQTPAYFNKRKPENGFQG